MQAYAGYAGRPVCVLDAGSECLDGGEGGQGIFGGEGVMDGYRLLGKKCCESGPVRDRLVGGNGDLAPQGSRRLNAGGRARRTIHGSSVWRL